MLKFKKVLTYNIIAVSQVIILLFTNTIIYPFADNSLLRIPAGNKGTYERLQSKLASNPAALTRRGFFLITAAGLLETSCSIPEYVERANRLYERAKAEPDYMEKIRILEALVCDNSNLNLALFPYALLDLFTLQYRVNIDRTLKTYSRYCKLGFAPRGAFTIDYQRNRNETIVDLYELLGEFDKAEQFCLNLLRPGSNLSDEDVKILKGLLKKLYYLTGNYDKALSLEDNPYLRQIKEKLDGEKRLYPPLDGKIGDTLHFSKNPKTPLYIFVNPDNPFSFDFERAEVFRESIKRKDSSVFINLFEDINKAFSCLSGGSFGLDLKRVSFNKIRPLVPISRGLETQENTRIGILTSADIAPLLGKGFIMIIGYPAGDPGKFMMEYDGNGVIFVNIAGLSLKGAKLNFVHEILHGLGMFHPIIPPEILIMKSRGYVFPEGYFDSIESAGETERHHLDLSEPTRIKLRWPKIPRIPLTMPTLQEDIEKVLLPRTLPRRGIILPRSSSI